MKIPEMQYAGLVISLSTLGQTDLAGNEFEALRTLEYLLEQALENVQRVLAHDGDEERRRHQIEEQNEDRRGWIKMSDEQKIAFYDALAAHLVATLDRYYTTFDAPADPRYDSGDAQTEPTYVMGMEIEDGYLNIEIGIQGWADSHTFSIELPTLTRSNQT